MSLLVGAHPMCLLVTLTVCTQCAYRISANRRRPRIDAAQFEALSEINAASKKYDVIDTRAQYGV